MRLPKMSFSAWLAAATCLAPVAVPAVALAQTAGPASPSSEKPNTPEPVAEPTPPPPGLVIDGIKLSAQLDAGFMLNPYRPNNGLNFGQLFTDHANQAQLNQLLLTASKPLDPKDPGLQLGFKLQFMYGSDARYTQFLGVFNRVDPGERYQLDLVEANVLAHLPYLTEGGIDLKAGMYSTPLGYETIDPSTNPFYSHSYIFQFGLPFKHTGVLTTTHVSDMLDIYAGLDTGTNTTLGPLGDNNSALGGVAGFGLNGLMDGKLTVLALTHFGPEQATRALSPIGVNANGQWRYFNDVLFTYKPTDVWTFVTEFNWARDDYGFGKGAVNAFGAAQYVSYALSDTIALNARAEIFRDDSNFFVASFSGNNDPIRVQQGLPAISAVYGAPGSSTTYSEITLGVTYKPEVPAPISGLLIRPEVRWDHAYTNNKPFNQGNGNGTANSFTLGADVVLTF